ncbi:MAG: hypothetical protein K8S98_04930 [Planctomycetes bacterium]|nr:hypothetical protein [Planctomycetota bacterium]
MLLLVGACSEPAAVEPTPSKNARAATSPAAPVHDAAFLAAAERFELGDFAGAESGLLALPDGGGVEGELLRARLAASRGDDISALRTLEAAKVAHPRDARVLATAAELHAAAGRTGSAEDEIRAGLALDSQSPDLRRARGVLLISKAGGAEAGLDHLLAARAADPQLPFTRRALSEAHRLVATLALSKQDAASALQHVSAALIELPDDADLKLLGADAHMVSKHFEQALSIYEDLYKQGRDVGATLAQSCKTAATAALLEKNRPLAIERFLRARELGLGPDALGFGATALADECKTHIDLGWKAYDARDFAGARDAFALALRYDPTSLDARRDLGMTLFSLGDAQGASDQWRLVLDTARAKNFELAEPVYLDLARALYQLHKTDEVREVLERELTRKPDGPGSTEAREMLQRLDPATKR